MRPKELNDPLHEICLRIADMPEAWQLIPRHGHHGIRRRVHGRYLLFCRIEPDRITVSHVLNGAMEAEGILFPDG